MDHPLQVLSGVSVFPDPGRNLDAIAGCGRRVPAHRAPGRHQSPGVADFGLGTALLVACVGERRNSLPGFAVAYSSRPRGSRYNAVTCRALARQQHGCSGSPSGGADPSLASECGLMRPCPSVSNATLYGESSFDSHSWSHSMSGAMRGKHWHLWLSRVSARDGSNRWAPGFDNADRGDFGPTPTPTPGACGKSRLRRCVGRNEGAAPLVTRPLTAATYSAPLSSNRRVRISGNGESRIQSPWRRRPLGERALVTRCRRAGCPTCRAPARSHASPLFDRTARPCRLG